MFIGITAMVAVVGALILGMSIAKGMAIDCGYLISDGKVYKVEYYGPDKAPRPEKGAKE